MTNHTARMAALLGKLRREMNGAVAESMQRGEGGYGLNYGVSIPTIRAIAGRVGTDHAFARFLYRQDVRELRMAALTIADPVSVTPDNVDEWFVGRMPEELIEELALRLLSRCGRPVLDTLCGRWLRAGSGAERYAALMALARARVQEFDAAAIVEAVPMRWPPVPTICDWRAVRRHSFSRRRPYRTGAARTDDRAASRLARRCLSARRAGVDDSLTGWPHYRAARAKYRGQNEVRSRPLLRSCVTLLYRRSGMPSARDRRIA